MRKDLESRFWRFHLENPDVFAMIWRLANEAKEAGREQYSMSAIFQRLRWYRQIEKKEQDFKLNDGFSSRYARLLESLYPEFRGFFAKRSLKTESGMEN